MIYAYLISLVIYTFIWGIIEFLAKEEVSERSIDQLPQGESGRVLSLSDGSVRWVTAPSKPILAKDLPKPDFKPVSQSKTRRKKKIVSKRSKPKKPVRRPKKTIK